MTPFLSSSGGNCQDAVIAVEDFTVTVKPLGAAEGAAIKHYSHDLLVNSSQGCALRKILTAKETLQAPNFVG